MQDKPHQRTRQSEQATLDQPSQSTTPLHECGRKARELLDPSQPKFIQNVITERLAQLGYPFDPLKTWPVAVRHRLWDANEVVETIRRCPALLLQKDCGVLLEALVDLLEAASFGESKRRISGVVATIRREWRIAPGQENVPDGEVRYESVAETLAPRRPVADHARRALQALASGKRGRAYNYPDELLREIVKMFHARIVHLQAIYREATTFREFKAQHTPEFRDFRSDREILSLLKAADPLRAAAGLAEKETLLNADAFLKTCRSARQ